MSPLLIVGAGGHGAVVAEAAQASGQWTSIGFYDDRWPGLDSVLSWPVLGSLEALMQRVRESPHDAASVIVAIGDNHRRLQVFRQLAADGARLATVIHPTAVLSPSATVGPGSVLMAGTVVQARARLGSAAIVNTRASVDHDGKIGDGVHLCPGSNLAGQVTVGDLGWVGIGASVIQGLTVGTGAVVGAGAAVVRHVPDGMTVVGCPAREMRHDT